MCDNQEKGMSLKRHIFIWVLISAILSSPLLSVDNVGKASSTDAPSTDSALPQSEVEYLFLEFIEEESLDSGRLYDYTATKSTQKCCCDFNTTGNQVNLAYYVRNQRIDNSIDAFKKVGQRLYQLLDIPPPLL